MPDRIGRYDVRSFLGERGRLHVYQVFDARLKRDLAITILAPQHVVTPALTTRFRDEASRLASLRHPAIVPVFDYGEWHTHPYIVMPHLVGGSLTARRMAGRLPLTTIVDSIERCAEALAAAYAFGVTHGRLQPASILYNERHEAYLTDFIPALAPPMLDGSYADRGLQPVHFLSPERAAALLANRPAPPTLADEVYSLGAVLYFALAGIPPFQGQEPAQICQAHIQSARPNLPPGYEDIPAAVSMVIRIALAQAAAERYSSPTALAAHLRESAAGRHNWHNPRLTPSVTETGTFTPAPRPRITGQYLGRYELIRIVGRGAMGIVFEAYDPELRRLVALKVLPGRFMDTAFFHERFRQEAELVASLGHPAIVPVYNLGVVERRPFIVMPYLSGGTLADRLTDGPLPLAEVVPTVMRVAGALDAAHAQGIIHRDVKPANILFDNTDAAHLADFGIAMLQASTTASAPAGGTPKYMSPEQVAAVRKQPNVRIDIRSDVYSLGVVLYHMLAGQPPFHEGSVAAIILAHLTEAPPPLPDYAPDSPLARVSRRALAKAPTERYQTAGDLALALQVAVDQMDD